MQGVTLFVALVAEDVGPVGRRPARMQDFVATDELQLCIVDQMPLAWCWPIHVLGVAVDLEKAVAVERMANNAMLHVEIVANIDRRLAVDHFRGWQPGLKVLSRWAEGVEHKIVP